MYVRFQMSDNAKDSKDGAEKKDQEQALVKMYMELTGANESSARGVYMLTCDQPQPSPAPEEPEEPEQKPD